MSLAGLLSIALTWSLSIGGAYLYGVNDGDDRATAAVAREKRGGGFGIHHVVAFTGARNE